MALATIRSALDAGSIALIVNREGKLTHVTTCAKSIARQSPLTVLCIGGSCSMFVRKRTELRQSRTARHHKGERKKVFIIPFVPDSIVPSPDARRARDHRMSLRRVPLPRRRHLPAVMSETPIRDLATIAPIADAGARRPSPSIPSVNVEALRVAVAESREELDAAHGLVHRRYRWRGYEIDLPLDDAQRREADASSHHEVTIIAAADEAGPIGTCTLGFDGPHGLRADVSYGDVIQKARDAGRRVGEITRLAVDSRESKTVLASLFNLAYVAGKAIDDVTDVFIEVNPRHLLFYTRLLGFSVAAGERICKRAGAPSVLLHVEVKALAGRLEELSRRALTPPLKQVA